MNDIIVPKTDSTAPQYVLAALSAELDQLTPQLRKAAVYVLENPNQIGVSSIREISEAADVKPNTLVRMARTVGFDGFEDFREPFREEIRQGGSSFPDRARWLQSLPGSGRLGNLFGEMAASAIQNIEDTFAGNAVDDIRRAAEMIVRARRTFVLGVGVNHTLAQNFTYLAEMGLDTVDVIPTAGGRIEDSLARAGPGDVLLAMTFKPYRREVVAGVDLARSQGVQVIGISDSPAAPIIIRGDLGLTVYSDTPQFFPSTVAATALLETLIAFVVASAGPSVIKNIEAFHDRRQTLGIYLEDPQ